MALSQSSLGFPTLCSAGATTAVYTVSSSKKTYIRSIVIHNANVGSGNDGISQNVQIHMVENSGGSAGTATTLTKIARVTLVPDDTFFYEPQYPITLESNGDTIQIYNEGNQLGGSALNPVNVVVLGDKDS